MSETAKIMPWSKKLTLFAILILVVLFGWFVWPTPWSYYHDRSLNLRVNRFTGETQVLTVRGWFRQ